MLLTRLHRNRPVGVVARVNLQALLIGIDIQPDTRALGPQRQHAEIRRFRRRIPRSIEDERVVVARAVVPAAVRRGEDVPPDLLGGSEVIGGAVHRADGAGGHFDVVDLDVPSGVGHLQGVVQDGAAFCIDKGAEVPVDVVGEHDGRGFVQRDGDEARSPCRAGGDGICCVGDDVAGKPLEGLVEEGEGDGGGVGGDNGPVALVVANVPAVEGVVAHVVVLGDLRGCTLDSESAVLDTIGVAANNRAEVGMYCLIIAKVVGGIVVSQSYVLRVAVLVIDVEIGQASTIWDESSIDARCRYGILL